MNLKTAQKFAAEVHAVIAPLCEKCEIAGSIRRRKLEDIKDIEIVAIPSLIGYSDLKRIVNSKWGLLEQGRFPSKYTRIRGLINIDFFWCSRDTFGLNLFIRTGPKEFVTNALVHWKEMNVGRGYSDKARLWKDPETIIETPTEESVFEALKWGWVPPEKRG